MEGKRPRGRLRMGMTDDVLDETYGDMKRKAENRENLRVWKPRAGPWLPNSQILSVRELMMMMMGTVNLSSDCTGLGLCDILCLGTVIFSSDCTGLGHCDIRGLYDKYPC